MHGQAAVILGVLRPTPGPGFSPSSLFVFPGACLRIMWNFCRF